MPPTNTPPVRRPDPLRLVPYSDCRDYLQTGDVGLSAGRGIATEAIKKATNSDYSHALMLGWACGDRVLALSESTAPRSHTVPFAARVGAQPDLIDVYRLRPEVAKLVNLEAAWEFMFRAGDQDYPEQVLVHDWAVILGMNVKHYPNSDDPEERRVCSQLVHAALRVAGMPPIVEHDCEAYPSTLANPEWFQYVCTPTR